MSLEQSPISEGQSRATPSIAGWVLAVIVSFGTLVLFYPFIILMAGFSQDAPGSDIDVAMMILVVPIIVFIVGIPLAAYTKKRLWLFLPHMAIAAVLMLSTVWSLFSTLVVFFI